MAIKKSVKRRAKKGSRKASRRTMKGGMLSFLRGKSRRVQPAHHASPKHESPKHESTKHESPKHESPKHESPKHESPKHESPEDETKLSSNFIDKTIDRVIDEYPPSSNYSAKRLASEKKQMRQRLANLSMDDEYYYEFNDPESDYPKGKDSLKARAYDMTIGMWTKGY